MKSHASSPPGMITLILLTSLALLSLNMFLPSLAHMAESFDVKYAVITWAISGYLLVTAGVQLIVGPMSDRYGRRPVMLVCLAIFVFSSIGCMLATDIWIFLLFRIFQGAIVAGMVLAPAVIRDTRPAGETASLMGYVSMAIAIAPMTGPMIGGVIDEMVGWRGSFAAFALLGALLFIVCWFDMGETNKTPSETFYKQFRDYPVLFQSRRFWGYSLCISLSVGAFYAFLAGAPFVTKTLFAMPTSELGFYLGTISIGYFIGSYLSGRFSSHHDLTTIIIYGRLAACFGLAAGLVLLLCGYVNVIALFGATMFVGLGNGLTRPGCSVGVMSVRPGLAGSASGLMGALQVGLGAIVTIITTAALTPEHGAHELLGIMLFFSFLGLLSVFYVVWVNLREPLPDSV